MWIRRIAAGVLALMLLGCVPGPRTSASFPPADPSAGLVTTLAVGPAQPTMNGCTAPASGMCGGCSVTCPADRPAFCRSGLSHFPDFGPPRCRQSARCFCG